MGRFSVAAFLFLVTVSFLADVAEHILVALTHNPRIDYSVRMFLTTIREYPWRAAIWGLLFGLVCYGLDTQHRRITFGNLFQLFFLPPLFRYALTYVVVFALGWIPHFPIPPHIIAVGLYGSVLALVVNGTVYVGYGPGTVVVAGFACAGVSALGYAPEPFNLIAGYFYTVLGAILAYQFAKNR